MLDVILIPAINHHQIDIIVVRFPIETILKMVS